MLTDQNRSSSSSNSSSKNNDPYISRFNADSIGSGNDLGTTFGSEQSSQNPRTRLQRSNSLITGSVVKLSDLPSLPLLPTVDDPTHHDPTSEEEEKTYDGLDDVHHDNEQQQPISSFVEFDLGGDSGEAGGANFVEFNLGETVPEDDDEYGHDSLYQNDKTTTLNNDDNDLGETESQDSGIKSKAKDIQHIQNLPSTQGTQSPPVTSLSDINLPQEANVTQSNNTFNIRNIETENTHDNAKSNINNNKNININNYDDNENSILYDYSDNDYDDDDDEGGEWQEMPTVANNYNVYDDKGELINTAADTSFGQAANQHELDLKNAKSKDKQRTMPSSKGYTRIAIQLQAENYAETDKRTDFLFRNTVHGNSKENVDATKQDGKNKKAKTGEEGEDDDDDEDEDEDEDDEYNDDFLDDTTRDALDQMQATKEMLKEDEIFAYVGLVKLLMTEMATDLAKINTRRLKNSKRLSSAQASLAVWSQKVMANLYEHMDVTKEEKRMIENLSNHGVEPADLARSLAKVESIKNPMYENEELQQNAKLVEMEPNDDTIRVNDDDDDDDNSIVNNTGDVSIGGSTQADVHTIETQKDNSNDPVLPNNLLADDSSQPKHEKEIPKASTDDNTKLDTTPKIDTDELKNKQIIDIDVAWTVICDLFLILIYDSVYDSRSRTLLMKFGETLHLTNFEICQFERRLTDALEIDEGSEQTLDESEIINYRAKKAKKKRMIYIGLAGVGGSLILGISGGVLGPLIGAGIAAGLSTVGIAGTSTFLAGTAGTAIVTTVSTGIGAKVGAAGMMRRTGAVKTFEFRPLHSNRRVNLIITVSGWMNSKVDDIRLPFSTVDPVMGDLYSLLWEPEMLTTVGQTINILATEILTQSVQQILGATVLTALMAAIQVPMALSKLGYLLDNPWNVSLDRAWAAGLILADTLLSRNLGVRPVTLVGFSIGSRLIYSCLLELAKKGAFDLVENVIIFGSPFVCDPEQLALCRSVVSGKFISGYSKKDWILGYLFRATSGGIRRVVGLSPIENVEGIESFDCTPYVTGHMEYRKAMPKLLKLVGWNVLSEEFIEIDEPDPEQSERQRELVLEFDKNAQQIVQDKEKNSKSSSSSHRKSGWKSWFKPKRKEWWEVYAEGQRESGTSDKNNTNKENTNEDNAASSIDEGSQSKQDGKNASSKAKIDPNAEYEVFNVNELKKEINELKKTGELQKANEELQKKYNKGEVDTEMP